jgi:hypothetical protein
VPEVTSIVTSALALAGVPDTPPTEQIPAVPLMVGMTGALVDAFTVKVPP